MISRASFIITLIILFNADIKAANNLNVKFVNLNDEYGVSIREANSVCSDKNGFIWVSSKMGILRYTQNDIRTYQLPYESMNVKTNRLIFNNGSLYSYTNNGQIFKYNEIQDQFELIANLSKTLRNPYLLVPKIWVDKKEQFWMITSVGFFTFHNETGLRSLNPKGYVSAMAPFDEDVVLLAFNGKLVLVNLEDLSVQDFYNYPSSRLSSVSFLKVDNDKKIVWIGTMSNGMYALDYSTSQKSILKIDNIPDQPIMDIESCSDSILLVGIDGQGVWELDKNSFEVLNVLKENPDNPNSLKGNGIYDVYCASDNRIWVCTYTGGASFFDKGDAELIRITHLINNPNSLINDNVNAVLEDSDGNLWFATDNGISTYSVDKKWKSYYHNQVQGGLVFLSLNEDVNGRIWAGTYSSGVFVLDKNGREVNHFSKSTHEDQSALNFVFGILNDSSGNVWIGGVREDLVCYDVDKERFREYAGVSVSVMRNFNANQLLIATAQKVIILEKTTGQSHSLLEDVLVVDMFLTDSIVWMCTSMEGVLKYDFKTGNTKRFTTNNGLPSNYTNSITFAKGFLWIGTEQGFCSIDINTNRIQTYNHISGLNNVSFNKNAHCTLSNGKLMFGTNNGALVFDPQKLNTRRVNGQIYFQELIVNGRSIRESPEINLNSPLDSLDFLALNYNQNNFSLELIPINTNISEVKFSWKLEGIDKDWTQAVNHRFLTYSSIPGGSYTLKIRMYDYSMTEVISQRELMVDIKFPFWQTWWFTWGIFAMSVGIVLIIILYKIGNLKKKHSDEKIRFFANATHDMRTSLTLINGPIEELSNEQTLSIKGKGYLKLAIEQSRRLSNIVTRLMDFQKVDIGKEKLILNKIDIVNFIESRVKMFESSAKSHGISIAFLSNVPDCKTLVDEIIVEKIVDNLLSNAVKYSFKNTEIKVSLHCSQNKWTLQIDDNGIGIDRKAQRYLFKEYYRGENAINSKIVGSGIGLLLVKNYALLHGGSIKCDSQINQGSTFIVTIPIKDSAKDAETQKEDRLNETRIDTLSNVAINHNPDSVEKSNKMKVVVVEDNEYLRSFLVSALCDDYEVFLAEDGVKGWDVILKQLPDLIISDIMMPNMNGFDFCEKVKSTIETSHIAVILLTALAGQENQIKGLGLGADDYLIKPFNVKILKHRINSIIRNREIIKDKALRIIRYDESDEVLFTNELNDKFLRKMVETVKVNLNNPHFSKDDFATSMNVSPSLLYKKIKSLTNQSPTDFIKIMRLERSVELLKTKQHTITEISEICGFSSVGYFSTVFKKHYDKAPSQLT